MSTKSKIIAICNQKGGVGKTVTTVNLGIGLARQGKRVLLVDVDAQGSLTASLGYQHPDQLDETLATVLGKVIEDKPLLPSEGILHQEEGVDLLPANIDLAAMEVTLVNIMSAGIPEHGPRPVRHYTPGLLPLFGYADNQRFISRRYAYHPHDGPLPVPKRHGTAYEDHRQGKTANQPKPYHQRYSCHHG